MTGSEIVVKNLIKHGVDIAFGYIGGSVLDLFDELRKNRKKIKIITTASEQGACHCADGYVRAGGETGVVIATSGPGATNLVTGIATAYMDSVPLVVICGNVSRNLIGRDSFQEVDIVGITMGITKHNFLVTDIDKLDDILDEAFYIANSGRPAPVLVDIPKDIFSAAVSSKIAVQIKAKIDAQNKIIIDKTISENTNSNCSCNATNGEKAVSSGIDTSIANKDKKDIALSNETSANNDKKAVALSSETSANHDKKDIALSNETSANHDKKTLNMGTKKSKSSSLSEYSDAKKSIASSKRPFIYVGGGVVRSDCGKEIIELAKKLNAPIGASLMGLSAVDNGYENYVGLIGMHGLYGSSEIMSEADLIIAVGTRFSDRATGDKEKFYKNREVLHIDIDPSEIGKNIPAYFSLVGDAKEILEKLLPDIEYRARAEWIERVKELRYDNEKCINNGEGLTPKKIIEATMKYTNENTVIATDVGQHQMWVAQYYKFVEPKTFLTPGGLGTMGFGMGGAIGAAIKTKELTVLFTGDGSFMMNMNELSTAVAQQLPIVVIVMNNGALGMVKQWQQLFKNGRLFETEQKVNVDFAAMARAMGATAYNVSDESELDSVLKLSFSKKTPVVINVKIDSNEKVMPVIPPEKGLEDIILKG